MTLQWRRPGTTGGRRFLPECDVIDMPADAPVSTVTGSVADAVNDAGPAVTSDLREVGHALASAAHATAAAATDATPPGSAYLHLPSHWPLQGDLLHYCHEMGPGLAVGLILGGIVYLLFGYYIFKILVTLNAALLGAYFGAVLGEKSGAAVPAAVIGGLLSAAATWPVMRYAVAIMGGIFGAMLGVTVWNLCQLDPLFAWSGALTGIVFCGLLSFILFKQCIMSYTSLQGSVMLVLGVLALIFKYDGFGAKLSNSFSIKPFLLPMTIFVPTLIGFIYQQTMFNSDEAAAPAKK